MRARTRQFVTCFIVAAATFGVCFADDETIDAQVAGEVDSRSRTSAPVNSTQRATV